MGRESSNTTARKIRGAFVNYGSRAGMTGVLAEEVRHGPDVSRQALLGALDLAELEWKGRDPGKDRDRALDRLGQDLAWLKGSEAPDAASLAGELTQDQAAYVGRQQNLTLAGLAVCGHGASVGSSGASPFCSPRAKSRARQGSRTRSARAVPPPEGWPGARPPRASG